MRTKAFVLVFCVAAAPAACGLDLRGTGDAGLSASGSSSGTAGNAPADGAVTGVPDSEAGALPPSCTCAIAAPAGFTLVAYAGDRAAACAGDLEADDRVMAPTAAPNACSCGTCAVTTLPSCNTGDFSSMVDLSGSPQCDLNGTAHSTNNGLCAGASNNVPNHGRAVPPSPSGSAACISTAVPNDAAAQTTPVRVCALAPGGHSCACDAAPGFKTCFRAPGDVPCPSGQKTLIGTGASITCAACSCAIMGQSCSGTIAYYSDSNCHDLLSTIDDTACVAQAGSSFNSYKWTGTAKVTCAAGAPPAGTAALTAPETICCP